MADEVRVVHQDDYVDFDENGKMRTRIRVTFRVGDHGPFLAYFDKEGFSGNAARNKLEDFAREVRALKGS